MLVFQLPQILYIISTLLVSYQSMVLLVQVRVKDQRHWIDLISFQFLVTGGYAEQISEGRSGHIRSIAPY